MAAQYFIKDLTGHRFGRLTVLSFAKSQSKNGHWNCQCECGKPVIVTTGNLKRGTAKSCGCLRKDNSKAMFTRHGLRHTPEYNVWLCAKNRCFNPNAVSYRAYGARGITMCARWRDSFEAFYEDMGPRPDGCTLDRIDNDGPYAPDNCRWTSVTVQNNNQRRSIRVTHNGETLSLKEWGERLGISERTMRTRYGKGLPLFIPLQREGRRKKKN